MIHVCSLRLLDQSIAETGASHLITLINEDTMPSTPAAIAPENHLRLGMNDIIEPIEGLTPPSDSHVDELIEFVTMWDRQSPMVIHCWAGISRSTAAGYVALCQINPDVDEQIIAASMRSASPSATPNRLIVEIADRILNRNGRMVMAIDEIGRGALASEGNPFSIPVRF